MKRHSIPWRDGYAANCNDVPLAGCPYDKGLNRQHWRAGWQEAERIGKESAP